MRVYVLFPILLLILAFNACSGPVAESTSFTPPTTPGGRLCAAECNQAHSYCRETCSLESRQCTNKVQAQALLDYEKYMSEQFLHANAIEYRLRDFEHLEPCEDEFNLCAATCEQPYQSCYANCGGVVETHSSCQFMCF